MVAVWHLLWPNCDPGWTPETDQLGILRSSWVPIQRRRRHGYCLSPQVACKEKNDDQILFAPNQCCYQERTYHYYHRRRRRPVYKDGKLIGTGSMLTQLNSLNNLFLSYIQDLRPDEACSMISPPSDGYSIYKKHRPTIISEYKRRTAVIPRGDPHIPTLDGFEYPFMGIGVYTVLHTALETPTVVQANMRKFGNGSVFSGLALSYPNHSIECYMRWIFLYNKRPQGDSYWT